MKCIYEKITLLCAKNNMSIRELERTLNFTSTTIHRWANVNPTLAKIQSVADYFNVSVDYLLGRTDIPSKVDEIFENKNIRTIQRLQSNLSPRDNEKMMRILLATFEEDFPKEDSDGNI